MEATHEGPSRDPIVGSKLKPRPIDWLWQERIPRGMISVVAGKPDQGKGLFGARLTADVSSGQATGKRENVLFCAIEDDHNQMTGPRLQAAGADMDHLMVWRFILPEQMARLEEIVVQNEIALIVIDPFAGVLGKGISRFSDKIRRVTNPLSELAERANCAVVIIEHALKGANKNSDPLAAIGGTGSGLPAAARMAYLFGKDPKDGDIRLLAPVKNNLRDKPKALVYEVDVTELDTVDAVPYLVAQGEADIQAEVLFEKPEDGTPGRSPTKRAAAAEWLTRYLFDAGKPVKAGLVMEDALQRGDLTKKTVKNAALDMGVVKDPPAGGRNCTWALPDDLRKDIEAAAKAEAQDGGGSDGS